VQHRKVDFSVTNQYDVHVVSGTLQHDWPSTFWP